MTRKNSPKQQILELQIELQGYKDREDAVAKENRFQRERNAALCALLDQVPHHGPNGSYSKAEGGCWTDCVACEYEKLKKETL